MSLNYISHFSFKVLQCLCVFFFFFKGYFNTLRMEVHEHNIGVTLVCPGPVQTNVVANAFTEDVNKVL